MSDTIVFQGENHKKKQNGCFIFDKITFRQPLK